MTTQRTDSVQEIQFHNPRLSRVGIEVLSLAELREQAAPTLVAPQRVDFHLLMAIESGQGRHVVDFVEHRLRPGAVVLVRPGQVQQWHLRRDLQGPVVLISGDALAPSVVGGAGADLRRLALDDWPVTLAASTPLFQEALGDIARLRADIERFDGGELDAAIARHGLVALLLRFAREFQSARPDRAASPEAGIHRLFARELEAGFHKRWTVLDYARRLGYSQSTLSRACLSTAGHTAKEAIDRRVVLEAKRLLVHSQASVVQVGRQLGFTEPTNFVKFFRRRVGRTPLAFRSDARPG